MNSIYQSIWTDKTGTTVVVPETGKSAGKTARSNYGAGCNAKSFTLKTLASCLMLACGMSSYALPQGGVVTAGGASIANGGSSTTVTQTTQNAAINWQSFGVAAGQAVQFVQPNASSVALNRVLGPDPSNIFGNLSANGKVFLVNPNGILFGNGASVNVGGLVASTLNISDANLLAGKYIFSKSGSGGSVVNEGTINADGGYVALLGANVSNQGVISARLGTVALAAGNTMTLDMAGDKLLNVKVDQGAVNALVENGGLIQSDGGTVLMTAQAASSLLSTVVNNTGVVRAQTIVSSNGTIKLAADPVPASAVSEFSLLPRPVISFTGGPPEPPPVCVPSTPPPTVGPPNPPPTVGPPTVPPTVGPAPPPPTVGATNPPPTVVPTSSAPVALASYVVPTFSLPLIPQQVADLPFMVASFDSQPPVELVEVLPPQPPPVVKDTPMLPVPYVAPVRRPKQDRH